MVTKVKGSVFDEPTIPVPPAFISGSGASAGGTLASGETTTRTLTVIGAALGDFVAASLSVNPTALTITAGVIAVDTVTVVITNQTTAPIVLAVGDVYVSIQKRV